MIPILDTHDAIGLAHVDAQAAAGLHRIAAAAGDVTPAGPAADLPDRVFCLIYDRPSGRLNSAHLFHLLTLQRMQQEKPGYFSLVSSILADDADPLPEQRPPRRRASPL